MDTTENVIYLAGGCFWGMEYCIGIVTTTDYSKNEFEKFQLRGSDHLFDDFLLY